MKHIIEENKHHENLLKKLSQNLKEANNILKDYLYNEEYLKFWKKNQQYKPNKELLKQIKNAAEEEKNYKIISYQKKGEKF